MPQREPFLKGEKCPQTHTQIISKYCTKVNTFPQKFPRNPEKRCNYKVYQIDLGVRFPSAPPTGIFKENPWKCSFFFVPQRFSDFIFAIFDVKNPLFFNKSNVFL